jgi:hypothetical protein
LAYSNLLSELEDSERKTCHEAQCGPGKWTVRNYVSLVAEAVGCVRNYESDSLGRLKRSAEADVPVNGLQAN